MAVRVRLRRDGNMRQPFYSLVLISLICELQNGHHKPSLMETVAKRKREKEVWCTVHSWIFRKIDRKKKL